MEIFKLMGSLFIETSETDEKLSQTEQKSTSLFGTMSNGFGKVAKASVYTATAIVGASTAFVGGAIKMATSTASLADEIDKSSQRANMGAESYQKWSYALELSGISVQRLEYANRNLTRQLVEVDNGNQKSIDSFQRLGISMDDLANKSQEEIFTETILALADMEDETQRAAIGMQVLGARAYTDMIPMLNEGSESILEMKLRAEELGIVMSEDAVRQGADLTDAITDMKAGFSALKNTIGVELIPVLDILINKIIHNMPIIQGMIATITPIIVEMFKMMIPPIIQLIEELLPVLTELFFALMPILVELGSEIMPVLIGILLALLPIFIELVESVLPPVIAIFVKLVEIVIPPLIAILNVLTDYVLPLLLNSFIFTFDNILETVSMVFGALGIIVDMFKGVLGGLIDFLTGVFTGNWELAWQGISDIFGSIFNGLVELFKTPFNYIIDNINDFLTWLNNFSVPDWVPVVGNMSMNFDMIPRFLTGIDEVPYDFFPAYLDKGERVLTATENRAFNEGTLSPNQGEGNGSKFNLNFYNIKEKSTSFEVVRAMQKAERLGVI